MDNTHTSKQYSVDELCSTMNDILVKLRKKWQKDTFSLVTLDQDSFIYNFSDSLEEQTGIQLNLKRVNKYFEITFVAPRRERQNTFRLELWLSALTTF